MNLCMDCERWYVGSDGAHWRYAHHGRKEEEIGYE